MIDNPKLDITKPKVKVGIFDLTDCEGCELQFLADKSNSDMLFDIIEVVDSRLFTEKQTDSAIDIAFVEGIPLTKKDIENLLSIRERSKKLVAYGTCAVTGGIAAGLTAKEREKYAKKIYTNNYKLQVDEAFPLSHYVKVDFFLPGCPVDPAMLKGFLAKILTTGWFELENYPVCQECKANGNKCLLVDGQPCLGPIIRAGCNSNCVNAHFGCLGCLGLWPDANIEQFLLLLRKKNIPKSRIENLLNFYLRGDEEINKKLRSLDE